MAEVVTSAAELPSGFGTAAARRWEGVAQLSGQRRLATGFEQFSVAGASWYIIGG